MNAKIGKKTDMQNSIITQNFNDATKGVKLEKVILGDSTFTTFPKLKQMITFSEEPSEKVPEYDFTKSVCYQNHQVGTTIYCANNIVTSLDDSVLPSGSQPQQGLTMEEARRSLLREMGEKNLANPLPKLANPKP